MTEEKNPSHVLGFLIGLSCRYKVVNWLNRKFDQPKSAETVYFTQKSSVGTQTDSSSSRSADTHEEIPSSGNTGESGARAALLVGTDLHFMSIMFSKHCKDVLQLDVPEDFLELAASAMARLKSCQRSNVIYNLAKGVGTERPDETDSRFPVLRMPMGLVEYVTNFFVAEDLNSVSSYFSL